MMPRHSRDFLATLATRYGVAALFGCGTLLLLMTGWRLFHVGVLTAGVSTLPDAAFDGRPTLLVLFQPGDCMSYSAYLEQWNALAREGQVRVIGVPLAAKAQRTAGKPVLDYFTPAFPLRDDLATDAYVLMRQMGQARTPVAMLLDPAGRPRMVVPPGRYPREHVQARMAVRDYARAMFPLPKIRSRS